MATPNIIAFFPLVAVEPYRSVQNAGARIFYLPEQEINNIILT